LSPGFGASQDNIEKPYFKIKTKLGPVAHAGNPSYSEGRDQEHCGSKQLEIVLSTLSQIPSTKKG
jgi:hypothetical protein